MFGFDLFCALQVGDGARHLQDAVVGAGTESLPVSYTHLDVYKRQAILADFQRQILPAVTQWNHPGFMAYFGTSASTPGILAELLIAAMNTNGLHWKTSPAVAELEQVSICLLYTSRCV